MNKEELVQEVAKKTKVSQKQVDETLAAIVETIVKTVAKGKKVTLIGFGTFSTAKRAKRDGRNPSTGAKIKIPAKTLVKFKAGKELGDAVNKSK